MKRLRPSEPDDKGDSFVGAVLAPGRRITGRLGGVAQLGLLNRLDVRITFYVVGALLIILALTTIFTTKTQEKVVNDLSESKREAVEDSLKSKGRILAIIGAQAVGDMFDRAVANNEINEYKLFDRDLNNYEKIPNTNPQKYNAPYDSIFSDTLTGGYLPIIQEEFLKDKDVLYAAAMDSNGYVPVHNKKYSQELTGNPEVDLVNSRHKRIFDDEIGVKAAKNEEPFLIQAYKRDTGEEAWDISAPIYVGGEHWGAFRVGLSKERIESKVVDLQSEAATTEEEAADQPRRRTIAGVAESLLGKTVGAMLFSLLAMAVVSVLIARTISRPIRSMAEMTEKIAAGDLSRTLDVKWGAEPGELGKALNIMARNLRLSVENIRAASLQVSSAAEEMAATVQQQASAATQQSAAVSQTTAAMEELAATAQQMSESAEQVVEATAETQEDTQQGEAAVTDAAGVMEEIKESNEKMVQEILLLGQRSQEINEVMNLINVIADQTRLIAFNAAIEAAAAGEAGRRFSVVASEVRRLADNVTDATQEINDKVKEIQAASNGLVISAEQGAKKINEGVSRGQVTSAALGTIVEKTQTVTSLAHQISLGTQQQRSATEQVVEALREVSTGAQQVAKGSQETNQVITDLLRLSEELRGAVSHFVTKVEEED
jgi:methyl-accepting chemotaxis protein